MVEDGALGHNDYSKSNQELNRVDVLPWPVQSPDAKLIEALWEDTKVNVLPWPAQLPDLKLIEALWGDTKVG